MRFNLKNFSIIVLICSVIFSVYVFAELYVASNPDVGLVSPVNFTITNNASVIFNCTAATNLSTGISNISLWLGLDGQAMVYNRTNTSALSGSNIKNVSAYFNQFDLSDGLWHWNCKGFNGTSSIVTSGAQNYTIVIDTTAPVVTFTDQTLANDSYVSGGSLTMDFFITELWPANVTLNLSVLSTGSVMNYTTSTAGVGTLNLTLNSFVSAFNGTFANAVIEYQVIVSDNASNKVIAKRTLTTDAIDPVTSISNISAALLDNFTMIKANATSVAVRFDLSQVDTNLQNTSYFVALANGTIAGVTNTSFTPNTTITFSQTATDQEGNKLIYFVTKDKAGRESLNKSAITVDLAPSISLNNPATATWSTAATNLLNFTAINNDTNASSLSACSIWGNLVGANASYIFNKTLTNFSSDAANTVKLYNGTLSNFTVTLVEGNYTWAIRCNDTTSNYVFSENRTLYVDTTNPTASVTATESIGGSIIVGSIMNLGCTTTDSLDPSPVALVNSLTNPSGSVTTNPGSTYTVTQVGTYLLGCIATDASGRSTSVTTTFASDPAPSGSSSSGSSGGSGGASGKVVQKQTITLPSVSADSPGIVTISDPEENGVNQITFDVTKELSNVKITVGRLDGKPADVVSEAATTAAEVYKYVELTKQNMEDSDISKADIKFQVEKTWLTEQGADKERITLKRLVSGNWDKLPTSVESEDSGYVYYKAVSPGLSYFAIALEEAPVTVTEEELTEASEEIVKASDAEPLAEPETKSRTGLWITLVVLFVLLGAGAGGAYWWFFMRKGSNGLEKAKSFFKKK